MTRRADGGMPGAQCTAPENGVSAGHQAPAAVVFWPETALTFFLEQDPLYGPALRAAFRDRANAAMLPGPLQRFFYGDEPLPPPRHSLADWPTIAAPTLLIWGEQDVALGKELTVRMEPLFSGPFEVRYVPDSGHWVQQEQPALVNQWLAEFLG